MISSRAVAMHGLGYDSLLIAQHGLLPVSVAQPSGSGFFIPMPHRRRPSDDDDEEAIMLVIAAWLHVTQ